MCPTLEMCFSVCNKDKGFIIVDNHQSFKICIGSDRQGFCGVMEENMLRESMHMLFIINDVSTHKLFSP